MDTVDESSEKTPELPPPYCPEGAELQLVKHPNGGHGYLVVDGRETPEGDFHVVDAGVCPKCDREADGWEPPVGNVKFKELIAEIRKITGIDSDEAAHKAHLNSTGGYIHTCSNCATSFFVPASVARIKVK